MIWFAFSALVNGASYEFAYASYADCMSAVIQHIDFWNGRIILTNLAHLCEATTYG